MRRLTPVLALTMALLGGATILATIQLFLLELPLAALAVLLLGAGLAGLGWKLQVSAVASKKVERDLRALTTRVTHVSAASASQTAPAPSPAPATPSAPPARSVAEKLRSVGTYSPRKAAADSVSGRLAAQVTTDPDAPFRLFAATGGFGAPDNTNVTRRAIAAIASPALVETLGGLGTVHKLHPSVSAAELEHAQPEALVIEEDALTSGSWAGALNPHGSKLLIEIRVAMAWLRRHGGAIFVIPASGPAGMAADAMRADCTLVDDVFVNAQADAPPSLLRALAAYREGSQ